MDAGAERKPEPERMPAGRPSGEAKTHGRHLTDAEQGWDHDTLSPTRGEPAAKRAESEPPAADKQELEPAVPDVQPELVDPMLTLLARPPSGIEIAPPPSAAPQLPSELLDQLAARIVRRCSVGRDGDESTVRLEFGEGRFEGASVLVQSERGRVSVRIAGSEPEQRRALQGALRARLAARGVSAADVTTE